MALQPFVDRDDEQRIAGVQHVVETDDALRVQRRRGEIEIGGQRLARVIAVEVPEAMGPPSALRMSSTLKDRARSP